jgi:hypothetical protein
MFRTIAVELRRARDENTEINLTHTAYMYLRTNKFLFPKHRYKGKTQFKTVKKFIPMWLHDVFDDREYFKKLYLLKTIVYKCQIKINKEMEHETKAQISDRAIMEKIKKKAVEIESQCKSSKAEKITLPNGKKCKGWYVKLRPGLYVFFKKDSNFVDSLVRWILRVNSTVLRIETIDNELHHICRTGLYHSISHYHANGF